jgi:hypothetical protein
VLTIASTGKDPATGRLLTHQYRVEGPVMIFLTTTAINLDEEMLNRCLVLSVNEDREQTQAIHRVQREAQTLEGLLRRRDREAILTVHRNAQRLLKPVFVANPYARELTFLDTHAARPHEVLNAHPHHRASPPVPAATQNNRASWPRGRVHRSHAGRHRNGEPAGA